MTSQAILLLLLIILIQHETGGTWWQNRRRRRYVPPPCRPKNCQVGQWSQWSGCTHRCGYSGIQSRSRSILTPASCGGQCQYQLSERRACNRDACQNGGTPAATNCKCKAGFTGTCCEIVIPTTAATTAATTEPTTTPTKTPTTVPTTGPTTETATTPTKTPTTVPTTVPTTKPTTVSTTVPTTEQTTAPTTGTTTAPSTAPTTEVETTSVSPSCDGGYLPHTKCHRTYIKLGAFKEKGKARAMPVLLLTDRDCFSDKNDGHKLDWYKFEESIHSLACRCAELAKQNHWQVFGLQNYGECWSGPNAAFTFDKYGKAGSHDSVQILTNSTAQCDKSNPQECIGKGDINYVYSRQ